MCVAATESDTYGESHESDFKAVHKMVERVLSNHILMGTISQEILTFPFHDTILGINRQAWN